MLHCSLSLVLTLLLCPAYIYSQNLDDATFSEVVERMEKDAKALASQVEELFRTRCDNAPFEGCEENNYDDFLSLYPNQTCPGGESFSIPQCGDGEICSGLWDFTVSSVSLPSPVTQLDPKAIEVICSTRALDDWFIQKHRQNAAERQSLTPGMQLQGMYFGSETGVLRVYPARQSNESYSYDPRKRPWYVAASSGRKFVIMILDTSGSLDKLGRLQLVQDAAIIVVNTLSFQDQVAIVQFNSNASAITNKDGEMFVANEENKVTLISSIKNLTAGLETSFYAGFEKAFEIIDQNRENIDCNIAILFLTDGKMLDPNTNRTESTVKQFIADKITTLRSEIGHPILLFTYSVSGDGEDVDTFPKELACETEQGVWTSIEGYDKIPSSLSSYYQLFSLALSSDTERNFPTWVEPYIYKDGGVLGTTVSVPVYDRSKQPPVFIGVVGVDITMDALNALVANNTVDNVKFFAARSHDRCPSLYNLSDCLLESFRKQNGNDNALCNRSCTTYPNISVQQCAGEVAYPRNLWVNADNKNKTYEQRVCCKVGTNTTSNECPAKDERNVPVIAGAVVGGLCVLGIVIVSVLWFLGKPKKKQIVKRQDPPNAPPYYDEHIVELPPPTNPNLSGELNVTQGALKAATELSK